MGRGGIPMLTDFGLARMELYSRDFLQTTRGYAVKGGSIRWMAYELHLASLNLSSDSDTELESEYEDTDSGTHALLLS